MENVKFSEHKKGRFAVCGHVGVGHVHSHSGFTQDDSAGFAAASLLLKRAADADTIIESVCADPRENTVTVVTRGGGRGTLRPRRGITPDEAELVKRAEGRDAIFTQNIAVETFGRLYGQGASEVPVCLQGACALAALDTFKRVLGDKLLTASCGDANKYDGFAGTVLEYEGVPFSLMLVINGTNGGIGPDEDLEGNVDLGAKGELMRRLGADTVPTVIMESKAFIPAMADKVSENQYMIRAQEGVDCAELAEALRAAAESLNLPVRLERGMMPMPNGAMARATADLAGRISEAASRLAKADTAREKTEITAELARMVSEDAGGVTFMTSSLNDKYRGAGMLPGGISSVLSMVTTREYAELWKIPKFGADEANNYADIVLRAIKSSAE